MVTKGKRWRLDYEVEEETGGAVKAQRLRKDRREQQVFPFHKVGRSVLYDLDEINAVIEASRYGGKKPAKVAA